MLCNRIYYFQEITVEVNVERKPIVSTTVSLFKIIYFQIDQLIMPISMLNSMTDKCGVNRIEFLII